MNPKKLTVTDIIDRVNVVEDKRSKYYKLAERWEKAWKLQAFKETREQAAAEGREQVVLPDPFNSVNVALRMLSNEPDISVPSVEVTESADEAARKRYRFLDSLWSRTNRIQRTNVITDAAWYGLVRGRFVFDVRWVYDKLKGQMKRRAYPVQVRALDPLNVGIHYGPYGPLWAYHRYIDTRVNVKAAWPKLKLPMQSDIGYSELTSEVEVIDFWWFDDDFNVWNAVVVDTVFAKKPAKTDYSTLPLIEGVNDGMPGDDESYRGLSLLHPMIDLWQYACQLMSQKATGVSYYFWPMLFVQNELNEKIEPFQIGPGRVEQLPRGTKIDPYTVSPNVPLSDSVQRVVEAGLQKSTFPEVVYGESPGSLQAGYGVSLLADAAKGRINSLRQQLEWAIQTVNEVALELFELLAPMEGMELWAFDRGTQKLESFRFSPADIAGAYENKVKITPAVPTDLQKQTLGLRMVQERAVSMQTFRERFLNEKFPEKEEERILLEEALRSDEVRQAAFREALEAYYGPDFAQKVLTQNGTSNGVGQQNGTTPGPSPNPSVQPEAIATGPMGGGIPPEMQGQITPEQLGQGENPDLMNLLGGSLPSPGGLG